MIVKESMTLEMRKDITCTAGKKLVDMTASLAPEAELPAKLIIGKEKKNGKWCVYLEEETGENLVAKVVSLTQGDASLDDSDIAAIVQDNSYRIVICGPQSNQIICTLQLVKDETAANQKSDAETSDAIKAELERIVAEGIASKEEMDARVQFMHDNHVDNFLITRVLKGYRKYSKRPHNPSCLYVDPFMNSCVKTRTETKISKGLRAAVSRHAMICEGEKSVGKNVYLETIAWLMGMPIYLITFSRNMTPATIYGEKTTDNSAAEALAAFDPEILAKADRVEEKLKFALNLMYKQGLGADQAMEAAMKELSDKDKDILKQAATFKKLQAQSSSVNIVIDASELYDWLSDGGLMVFNEQNLIDPNFFASFANQLLDGTGFLFVPGRGEVRIHKDCVLFSTQNGDYQGVEQQNEATVSRFGCLYFEQPDSVKGQLIAATTSALKRDGFAGTTLKAQYYNETEAFYKQCRSAIKKQVITNACLNIRGFVRALTEVAESDGYATLKEAIKDQVINTCPFDERQPLISLLEQCVTL